MSVQTRPITAESVGAVFSALAAELAIAAQSCGHLDDAMGEIMALTPPESRMQVMQQLHTVDMLAQRITAVTDFMTRLARSAAEDAAFDLEGAVSSVTLGEVADRLKTATQLKAAA